MKSHLEWTLPAVMGRLFRLAYIMIFCFSHVFFVLLLCFFAVDVRSVLLLL